MMMAGASHQSQCGFTAPEIEYVVREKMRFAHFFPHNILQ